MVARGNILPPGRVTGFLGYGDLFALDFDVGFESPCLCLTITVLISILILVCEMAVNGGFIK